MMSSRIYRNTSMLVVTLLLQFVQQIRGAEQQPQREPLTEIVQLTSGFTRAGEAYFSPDMKWIVFQADTPYQMYLAELKWQGDRIVATHAPMRISPDKSHNTCGHFSPDGKSIIFGSTAGKESPNEPTGGYQRQG